MLGVSLDSHLSLRAKVVSDLSAFCNMYDNACFCLYKLDMHYPALLAHINKTVEYRAIDRYVCIVNDH